MTRNVQQLLTEHIDLWTSAIENKSSAGRGNSRKKSLYGIKKLRELILELAVRGKLVEQDPNDEPASELLKRIDTERERLVKAGEIKKPKKLPEINEKEKPFTLPEGWEWARLGNITSYGQTDKAEQIDVKNDTWVLELEDVEKSTSKLLAKVTFKDRKFKSTKNRFSTGDILYGKLRPYLDKVLVAEDDGVCTTEIIPIRAYTEELRPYFLRLSLKSPSFIEYANSFTHGMSLPRLGTDKARLALVTLPPNREQHRIVAKVEELMALCDQLEQQTEQQLDAHQLLVDTLLGTLTQSQNANELADNWTRLSQHFDTLFTTEASIDQLKQTILQLAVMGKLVPQNPNDEPASELLKRIAAEKEQLIKDKKIKKQKPLPPISDEEKPFELPKGWEWYRISELLQGDTKNGVSAKANEDKNGIPLLRISAATTRDDYIVNTDEFKLTSAITENQAKDYELNSGDLLAVRFNGNKSFVGRTAIFTCEQGNYIYPDKLIRIRLFERISNPFLMRYFINSQIIRSVIESHCATTVGNWGISAKNLKTVPVPLPPVQEQHRIVTKINELFTLCDQLKERLQHNQQTQLLLTDTLVQEALV